MPATRTPPRKRAGAKGAQHETQAARAEALVRDAILLGQLAPDERLILPALSKRFDVGLTPLREALPRLAANGLVVSIGHRGFRVAGVDESQAIDLAIASIVIEIGALRVSMARHETQWEEGVVLAMHRLRKAVQAESDDATFRAAAFNETHRDFHRALVAGCASPSLLEMRDGLFARVMRHRRIVQGSKRLDRDAVVQSHEALTKLVLSGDCEAAASGLLEHMNALFDIVEPEQALRYQAMLRASAL